MPHKGHCEGCRKRYADHQCANCGTPYCSSACQSRDWLAQHAEMCPCARDEALGLFGGELDEERSSGGGKRYRLSAAKAKIILEEGVANKHPIDPAQKRFFGWVAGGRKPYAH